MSKAMNQTLNDRKHATRTFYCHESNCISDALLYQSVYRKAVIFILVSIGCLFIFILWIRYETMKSNRNSKKISKDFWKKESDSNHVRKRDISNLPYINIPFDELPFQDSKDPVLEHIQNKVLELKNKKILNLTGITNTDLKLTYGTANLNVLMEYDANYAELVRTLHRWAAYLLEHNAIEEATIVLEFSIQCKTDISYCYETLAKLYAADQRHDKINDLIQIASSLNSITKNVILNRLCQP